MALPGIVGKRTVLVEKIEHYCFAVGLTSRPFLEMQELVHTHLINKKIICLVQ
jgi:hypothetical protein